MKIYWILLSAISLLIWSLTAGVHWASAIVLSSIGVLGGWCLSVLGLFRAKDRYLSPLNADWVKQHIAPFHGFGALGWMLLVMMTCCVVSLLPLPLSVLEVLSPAAADWYREAWQLAGIDRSWGYLTAAWGRTAFALWILIGSFGVYYSALRLCSDHKHLRQLFRAFVVAGCLCFALLGLKYLGFPIEFGARGEMSAWRIGFPINPNHASGVFSALSLMCLGGVGVRRDQAAKGALWLLFYAIFGCAVVLLKSRGALLGWGIGQCIVLIYLFTRHLNWRTGVAFLGAAGGLLAAILIFAFPTFAEIQTEFEDTSLTLSVNDENSELQSPGTMNKTQMYGDFWRLLNDWGRAGFGRSAFGDVYPSYQGFPFLKHFRHAENEFFEILMEFGWFWGSLCLILGAIAMTLYLRDFWQAKHERLAMYGLIGAIFALLIQNIFDFSLRYWTTGFIFFVFCGALQGRRWRWRYGRAREDQAVCTKRQKIEWIIGHSLWAIACVVALVTVRGAIDGHTQSGIRAFARDTTLWDTSTPQIASHIEHNLRLRAGNPHVRAIMAKALVHEGQSEPQKWQRAKNWYASGVAHDPWSAELRLHLAKLCLSLGDHECAKEHFIRATRNHPKQTSTAMWELSALENVDTLELENPTVFGAFIQALFERGRFDTAQKLISKRHLTDPVLSAKLQCALYFKLDLPQGCDFILDALPPQPMTFDLLDLLWQRLVRQKAFDQAFELFECHASRFKDDPRYWDRRLRLSVFYGQTQGEDWYQEKVPQLFIKYWQIEHQSGLWKFWGHVYDARYAFNRGQCKRARRSIEMARSYIKSHRAIQSLHQAIVLKCGTET